MLKMEIKDQFGEHIEMFSIGLSQMMEEYSEETGSKPAISEIIEILKYGIKSCTSSVTTDIDSSNIENIQAKLNSKIIPIPLPRESSLDDLNDNLYVLSNDLFTNIIKTNKRLKIKIFTIKDLGFVILQSLKKCDPTLLSDKNTLNISELHITTSKKNKIQISAGDIISIAANDEQYYIAVCITKNQFGTALGFFQGTHQLKPITITNHPPVIKYPIYVDDNLIMKGKWKILKNDKKLLSLFPKEPEIFHKKYETEYGSTIGPYGSGETIKGKLRELSQSEAEEIGLNKADFQQTYSSEHLLKFLPFITRKS